MSLQKKLSELADELAVPGVAAAVLHDGEEEYAFHGVTSVENPLPVDEKTLFQFGSTTKTFTATALMRLVEDGRVELEAPVQQYVPEFHMRDDDVASRVTVLQLLNHTAGWEGDLFADTGAGDDALSRYVERMADLRQEFPLGAGVSYNNAALCLAGRVIEHVVGTTYEEAITELLLQPLGLAHTLFFPNDIMTRRFSVGHSLGADDRPMVNRPWAIPRSSNPAGGASANAADQIAWARFHLGDGRASSGERLLEGGSLRRMQEPTAEMPGSAIGDAVGISWLLRWVDGVKVVAHGGTTVGQYSEFVMVPERSVAFISMSNCGPNGADLNRRLERWVLETYAGVVDREPQPVASEPAALTEYAGTYETVAAVCEVKVEGAGLSVQSRPKPEMAAVLRENAEDVPEAPPMPLAIVGGGPDRYVVAGGPGKGMRGYFRRDGAGRVDAIHLGGRLALRSSGG